MKLTFSQGIVSHSTTTGLPSGTANFYTVAGTFDTIQLNGTPEQPFIAAFGHRDTHYLLTVKQGTPVNAWGYGSASNYNAPFVSGGPYYLWIEFDRTTGETKYGYSVEQPSNGTTQPYASNAANRPDDLHWYNPSTRKMQVWRKTGNVAPYGRWSEVVRVFVAKYTYGSPTLASMSANAPSFTGTTGGLTGNFNVGSLVYDVNAKPVKRTTSDGATTFFTTEDVIVTGLPTGSRARYETFLVDGIGQVTAAAYSIVRFTDFNEVELLAALDQPDSVYGMIESDIGAVGDLVQVTVGGKVRNAAWNWSFIGQQLYVNKNSPGELVTVEDDNYVPLADQRPVAIALDSDAILLFTPTRATPEASGTIIHGNTIGLTSDDHPQYLTVGRGDARYYTQTQVDNLLDAQNELGELTNVTLSSPSVGEALVFQGGSPGTWGNSDRITIDNSAITLKQNAGAEYPLRFEDGTNSNYIGLVAPDFIYSSFTLTLPDADGTPNQVLTTDGSGNLSFTDGSTSFPLLAPDGSTAAPSYSFASDTGMGMHRSPAFGGSLVLTDPGGAAAYLYYDVESGSPDPSRHVFLGTGDIVAATTLAGDPADPEIRFSASADVGLYAFPSGMGMSAGGVTYISVNGTFGSENATITVDYIDRVVFDTDAATLKVTDLSPQTKYSLRFEDATAGNYIGLVAPDFIYSSFTLTLPDADGTPNQVLTTDGAGNLSFAAAVTTLAGLSDVDLVGSPESASDGDVLTYNAGAWQALPNKYPFSGTTGGSPGGWIGSPATITVSFATVEPDTNYQVVVTGDAPEIFYVTNKTVNGFDIVSSNPASTATVDWMVNR